MCSLLVPILHMCICMYIYIFIVYSGMYVCMYVCMYVDMYPSVSYKNVVFIHLFMYFFV